MMESWYLASVLIVGRTVHIAIMETKEHLTYIESEIEADLPA